MPPVVARVAAFPSVAVLMESAADLAGARHSQAAASKHPVA
jgi:hypothetical protein